MKPHSLVKFTLLNDKRVRQMSDSNTTSTDWIKSNRKNTLRLGSWTFAWVLTMTVTAFGPRLLWDYSTWPTVISLAVNLAAGIAMILANSRYLRGLDEMHKDIFLNACAITLGVGMVCGFSYELLEDIRLIPFQPEIQHLAILMCLTFMAGMLYGRWKYR